MQNSTRLNKSVAFSPVNEVKRCYPNLNLPLWSLCVDVNVENYISDLYRGMTGARFSGN